MKRIMLTMMLLLIGVGVLAQMQGCIFVDRGHRGHWEHQADEGSGASLNIKIRN